MTMDERIEAAAPLFYPLIRVVPEAMPSTWEDATDDAKGICRHLARKFLAAAFPELTGDKPTHWIVSKVLRRLLVAIAEGYPVTAEQDRYVIVENPAYQPDNGEDPNILFDVDELINSSNRSVRPQPRQSNGPNLPEGHVFGRDAYLGKGDGGALPDWDDLRGAAPEATGDLSSEEWVRKKRDEWRE